MQRARKSFWQIWNMNFGFLGIQFGWALQLANMSAVYEFLGARPDQVPILWLAAPLSGLIIQPLIGNASDHTWTRLGRRRPYFLVGAILSSLMLLFMPSATTLWAAAAALWILDSSINVSMEPFRAFVADLLPEGQRTRGFAMQSLFIGLGAVIASALPWLLTNALHLHDAASQSAHRIPSSVRISFYVGAAAFLAAVLWTVVTTMEYPPDTPAERHAELPGSGRRGLAPAVREIADAWTHMPPTMLRLGLAQLFTFLGLFCMWLYFSTFVAYNIFGASGADAPAFREGIEWGGLCSATYNGICFLFSFALPSLARAFGRKHTHSLCLLAGALGLLSVLLVHSRMPLLFCMVGVGIAWASTLSMPYAMLAAILPSDRTGIYMGIFNFFVVVPEILASLFFGYIMLHFLHNNRAWAVATGGLCLLLAALLTQRVEDPRTLSLQDADLVQAAG